MPITRPANTTTRSLPPIAISPCTPAPPESDLAQNIIGMSYYVQVLDPKRDQTNARKSLQAYQTLLQRYPDSRYAAEAQNRARILRDLLAASEMTVGRYYLRHNNYLAAINRFRVVVTDYQTTAQVEEALSRLTEAYMALGIIPEAQTAAAVLGYNYPDSKWYRNSSRCCKNTAPGRKCMKGRGSPRPGRATASPPDARTMLSALSIRDIVLIDRLDLEFGQGLCVLTGETGAGKSILLDAFTLAIGGRGDARSCGAARAKAR